MLLDKLKYYDTKKIISKNVCLIKSNLDNNALICTQHRAFNESYLTFFKQNNFDIYSPVNLDVIELYNLIHNCENLIISWGCNSWLNSIFVNIKTNVLILCHIGYQHEYKTDNYEITYNNKIPTLCTPSCKNLIMSVDLPTKLTDIIIK
uniref:Uncharacterized protein n=1 Tax=viral metagenome TaxID=1070528 RepID=A0A6C0B900_9ZZZZ